MPKVVDFNRKETFRGRDASGWKCRNPVSGVEQILVSERGKIFCVGHLPESFHSKGCVMVSKFQEANQLQRSGQLEEAVGAYRQAIAENPDFYWSYHNLGETLCKLGRLDEAVEAYRKAVALNPSAAWSHFNLGEVLEQQGKEEEAIAVYQNVLEMKSDWVLARNKLKTLLSRKEKKYSGVQKENSMTRFGSINTHQPSYKIGIKTSVPNLSESYIWGDFHFAQALKRAFDRLGHSARVHCNDAWETEGLDDDVVIVLRGRHGYKPKANQINLLWLISHPDCVTTQELDLFNHIFVASKEYTQKLSKQIQVPVSCMYQCTDPELFYESPEADVPAAKILFVGNSRNIFRPIVRDAINLGIELEIYGPFWEKFIPKKFIKATHIPNDILYKYYSNCTILLNDHWEVMRQEGFLSNRLFDGSACGTFIITDKVVGLNAVFGHCIETYEYPNELSEKIFYYLNNLEERCKKASQAKAIVRENHTFYRRAEQFLEIINKFYQLNLSSQFML